MAGRADEDEVRAGRDEPLGLAMDLGDERAGGVEIIEPARLGVGGHRFGHAVRRKHHRRAAGHLVQFLDEHRALGFQAVDHELVVDDFVADIDRRTVLLIASSTILIARSTPAQKPRGAAIISRSEEHTSELQSLMRTSYAVFCLKKKTT